MHTKLLPVALLTACGFAGGANAETILVGDQVNVVPTSIEHPARGATQAAVEAKFGAPVERHPTVGKPPITRWDYPGFSVFFEHDRVIHSVAVAAAAPAGTAPAATVPADGAGAAN
jgi:hypothetical protein